MKRKLLLAIPVILFLITCGIVSIFTQTGGAGENKTISIPKGFNANNITNLLYQEKIIKNKHFFKLSTRFLGKQSTLQAGIYVLSGKMTNIAIINRLKAGEVIPPNQVKITFPEGSSIYKMGKILKEASFESSSKFQKLYKTKIDKELINDYAFLEKLKQDSLEGYLFPDTYLFNPKSNEIEISRRMLDRFTEVVIHYWLENANNTKYNLHQILTLASIIEKEAQNPAERAIISSVFHNRLNIKMALDACPTIKYALNDPTKRVFLWQLKVKSPYNTYLNRGLPPGPICNPGIESIKAAIYPLKTKYFYFVAKNDGSHIFSKTLKEHNNAKKSIP